MFDDVHVFDSDGILAMREIPRSMVIVGAGVIGTEDAVHFCRSWDESHGDRTGATGCSNFATRKS